MSNMDKKIIFSGIQPSGNLHIGNYIGALSQWREMQVETEPIFCVVDLHAITVYQDPKVLREKILEVAALYIASGIDPDKSHIFVQSENPDHTYLAWILDCIAPFGQMQRMTQFKEKSDKQKELTSVGLFNYPALMAADILLYDTDEVPVGEDQAQHVELTRDLAEKFNKIYGDVFKLPKVKVIKERARIMSLQNPTAKMSKSDSDPLGTINLLDSEDQIREKIKRAVTDSGTEISSDEINKPAITNLLMIYCVFSGESPIEADITFRGKSYSEFKNILADHVVSKLSEIQNKYKELREDKERLRKILDEGRDYTISKSSKKMEEVKKAVGLGRL